MARIDAFLKLGTDQGCSDIHFAVGVPPMLRMYGDLVPIKFRELSQVADHGIPSDEIEAGKNQLKGQLTLSLESPASRMFRLASAVLYGEPFLTLDETLARIDAITPGQVAEVCHEFLRPERQTVVTLGPSADLP